MNATTTPKPALLTAPVPGSRHVEGQNLADVAKLVRSDIAKAVADGVLPKGLKASVRIERYSMGQSLDVRVVACPGVVVLSTKRIRFEIFTNHKVFTPMPRLSADGARVLKTIEALVAAYNDVVDRGQFCQPLVDFYAHVEFAGDLERAQRAEIEAALAATADVGTPSLKAAS